MYAQGKTNLSTHCLAKLIKVALVMALATIVSTQVIIHQSPTTCWKVLIIASG